ncbi:MAG: purine-binding chemotaxis protein CheW [Deltaproteobacteria bacterium]|nr:purine-binding chemotaxis protein CheW [Deltaproteobacteria bacterium]
MKSSILPEERLRLCVFSVGNELCAIDIMRIKEIIRPVPITPVPKAPFGMLGVIDLRGQVLPLFDLRKRLEVNQKHDLDHPSVRFLLIRLDGRHLGLVVDEVLSVVTVRRDELETETHLFTKSDDKVVLGMCPAEGKLALLLNVRALLSKDASVALDALGLPRHRN